MKLIEGLIIIMTALCNITQALADLKPASVFSDNMVLQREMPVPIWGTAIPGETVKVTFADQTKQTQTDEQGKWSIKLDPMPASSTPENLTISGTKTITYKNILVGEVWLCSGQSNMEWSVIKALNGKEEVANASYPMIRLFHVPRTPSSTPLNKMHRRAEWQECSPKSVKDFSALAYYFGRNLYKKLDIPIGLIDSSWGGTSIQAWTSKEYLQTLPEAKVDLKNLQEKLDETAKQKPQEINPLPNTQRHGAKDNAGFLKGWAAFDITDSPFNQDMNLPSQWQKQGQKFSGVLWFRKEVTIPPEWEGHPLKLSLGAIDKEDQTYFNGTKVGSLLYSDRKDSYRINRVYEVPADLVKKGRNVIATRVRSDFFDGGMTGPAEDMYLSCPTLKQSSPISLAGNWKFAVESNYGLCSPCLPTELYNGLISPLIPFAIRGSLWLQGENNTTTPLPYRKFLPTLITNWRTDWQQGNFPFYIVQLANWQSPSLFQKDSKIALLREAQEMALSIPNTAMTVNLDLGSHEKPDAHYPNKQEAAHRLALQALNKIYGYSDLPCFSPMLKECKQEGTKLRLYFTNPSGGLKTSDNKPPTGFVIAGKEGEFHQATATIDGDTIILESAKVTNPTAARYAWANNPVCNMCNDANFPMAPFRTDKDMRE